MGSTRVNWFKVYDIFGRTVIHGICTYELLGLHPNHLPGALKQLPTITKITHTYRHKHPTKALVIVMLLWLGYHLLFEESQYTYKFKLAQGVLNATGITN